MIKEKVQKAELLHLRECFDQACARLKLRKSTCRRYRSWIRRYIKYCSLYKLPLCVSSAESFIKDYSSHYTRRQGYYALKFFMQEVIRRERMPDFRYFHPQRKQQSLAVKKWWKRIWARGL